MWLTTKPLIDALRKRKNERKRGMDEAAAERAIMLDGSSPLTVILCAKSPIRSFKRPDLALARLDQAELLLASEWRATVDDMSREWYEQEISSLRQAALEDQL